LNSGSRHPTAKYTLSATRKGLGKAVRRTVVAGMDVVDAIGNMVIDSNDRPMEDVRLIEASMSG